MSRYLRDSPFLKRMIVKSYDSRVAAISTPELRYHEIFTDMLLVLSVTKNNNFDHYVSVEHYVHGYINYGHLIYNYLENIVYCLIVSPEYTVSVTKERFETLFEILEEIYDQFKYKIRINKNFYNIIYHLEITKTLTRDVDSYKTEQVNTIYKFITTILLDMASQGMSIDADKFSSENAPYDLRVGYTHISLKQTVPNFHNSVLKIDNKSEEYRNGLYLNLISI